ncbi:MAG: DUF4212 domain-containing protein [Burkholderiales bacterium]|nr:DUF4212 domain-containing protein [Burkholderiales bacterium]
MQLLERHRAYWRSNLRLTAGLLAVWFAAGFVAAFFARDLQSFNFFGWPFSFWMAAQGSLIVFVLIVWAYDRAMNLLDRRYGVEEADE